MSNNSLHVSARNLGALLLQIDHANNQNRYAINLVPSETRLSPLAHSVLSSDFYNRYFFNDQLKSDFWEFRGGQLVGNIERDFTIPALLRLARAQYANIRPISGLNTSLMVVSAYAGLPGNTVVSVSRESGGHFAIQNLTERLGYRSRQIAIRKGKCDPIELEQLLTEHRIALVYIDLQNTLHPLDVESFARVIRIHSPETILHVDASHVLGLVLGKAHANPLDLGADSFGGSTHKSFPGPQKGVVFTNRAELASALQRAQFDLISSHHFAETMALGVAALEFECFGESYAQAVIANAQALAQALCAKGFQVHGDVPYFTRTHQIWVEAGDPGDTARIGERLFEAGIRANTQQNIPGLPDHSFRLGTNETTFEGANVESMEMIAEAFASARDTDKIPNNCAAQAIRKSFGSPHFFSNLKELQRQIEAL